jgi:L-threonylcarbamoyladenylate synthase
MAGSQNLRHAARVLARGGIIAYPTEGVFGLGCLPDDAAAVMRILEIKERDPAMGLVLIASSISQLDGWVDVPLTERQLQSTADHPVTWIVPATTAAPPLIRGLHDSIAVRLTAHPVARALCDAAASALVSTSANISGQATARNSLVLRRQFGALVDYIVPGDCGYASGPSEIRDLKTGKILRPS